MGDNQSDHDFSPLDKFDGKLKEICIARAGDVVVIEAQVPLKKEQFKMIADYLTHAYEKTGVQFVILDDRFKVARVEHE